MLEAFALDLEAGETKLCALGNDDNVDGTPMTVINDDNSFYGALGEVE